MLVIVAAAGAWLWADRVRTIEAGERSVSALVRVLEEQTARSFEAVDLTLLGMIDAMRLNPSLAAHDAGFEESMRQRLRLLPYVRALYVIGPDGFIKQDTDYPKTPHVSLADRDYFQAHAKDPSLSLQIGQPLISRSLGVWFVSVSRRLDGPDGRFDGIAVAAVEPRYFERFYRDLNLGERDSIGLFRRDGIVMVRGPHRDGAIGTDWSENEVFRVHLPKAPPGPTAPSACWTGKTASSATGRWRLTRWWSRLAWRRPIFSPAGGEASPSPVPWCRPWPS